MAPIRRYLRITKYSVLEVRIYLDKPSDASWLLSTKHDVLRRIIDEIRPKVLPKLREENENAKRKTGKRKRGIKDVASQEDFEVTIFLTETSTRHSLLTKQKRFTDEPRIQSTGSKLTGWLNDRANPIHLGDDDVAPLELLREEDVEDVMNLDDIPAAPIKKKRRMAKETDDDEDALFVSSSDEETFLTQRETSKRASSRPASQGEKSDDRNDGSDEDIEEAEDKKKLALNTTYDGFSIYGRILCLVVKRKGHRPTTQGIPVAGSEMMEHWVSTQAAQTAGLEDVDDG